MKKAIMIGLIAALLMLIAVPLAIAAQQLPRKIIVQVWTDKQFYKPGEEGKLFIVVVNNEIEEGIFIENLTVVYPWWPSYINNEWVGSDTIVPTDAAERGLEYFPDSGDIYQTECSFKVPSDGRAKSGEIEVTVTFAGDYPSESGETYLEVFAGSPANIEGLDKIVTLLAAQIILTVLSALAIAAAVYLSVRKLARSPVHPSPPPSEHERET